MDFSEAGKRRQKKLTNKLRRDLRAVKAVSLLVAIDDDGQMAIQQAYTAAGEETMSGQQKANDLIMMMVDLLLVQVDPGCELEIPSMHGVVKLIRPQRVG